MKKHYNTKGKRIHKIPKGLTEQDLEFLNLANQYMVTTQELEDIIKREAKTRQSVNKYYEDNLKNKDWLIPNTKKLIAKLNSIYKNPFE